MRFKATHKLVTYLLALAALGTVVSTGSLEARSVLGILVVIALSWGLDAGGRGAALVDHLVTPARIGVGLFCAWATWTVARGLPEPDLSPVLNVVLVSLALKLAHRRNNRDDVHIFVLAFLLVLAAAAMGGSFLFGVAFVAYIVLATWALVLFHLRREMEENYLVKHSSQAPSQKVGVARILNSRRVVGREFFLATGAVALAVAGGSMATFALVPRVGAGFVFGAPRSAPSVVGFSDDVLLGFHGTLGTGNGAVALRAILPDVAALPSETERARAALSLYWRGTVYDRYEGGHWTRSRGEAARTHLGETHGLVVVTDGGAPAGHVPHRSLVRQEIDVAGPAAPVAFALDRPVAFDLGSRGSAAGALQLVPRWSGEVGLRPGPAGAPVIGDGADEPRAELRGPPGVHYVALSTTVPRAGGQLSPTVRAATLELPPSLAPRVKALAQRLAAGAPPGAGTVRAVAAWLRETHTYTLQLPRPAAGMDPVESFLFEKPQGHCEYFASAAALLLRAAGIPTRYVNGYLGGEWNELGSYVVVRDNRAHSWVEAYLPETGWTRVDATPALPPAARSGRLRQLLDSLDFKWSRSIVGYDLGRQVALAHRMAGALGFGVAHAGSPAPGGRVPGWVLVLVAVAAVAAAASRVWPMRAAEPRARPAVPEGGAPVQRLYARALERLARAGLPRDRTETPREYAARVKAAGADADGALAELTELYTAARFGGRIVDREHMRRLAQRVAAVGRGLARPAA